MAYIKKMIVFLFSQKKNIFIWFLSTIVFLIALFPLSDLNDLISIQVAQMSQNRVFLQFDEMHINPLGPGFEFKNISLQTPFFPSLSSESLAISPSLKLIFFQSPGGSVRARGFLGGDVDISLSDGPKSENGVPRQLAHVAAKNMNLKDLKELVQLPLLLRGQLNLQTKLLLDPTFKEQPDMEMHVQIDRFELPPSQVNTPMGPMALPDLKLSVVELKGRLSAGRFQIEEGIIGGKNDDLKGQVKGNIAFQIQNLPSLGINPVPGAYSFSVDLDVKKSFQDRAQLFLSFIEPYKKDEGDIARYSFKVTSTSPDLPPSISATH